MVCKKHWSSINGPYKEKPHHIGDHSSGRLHARSNILMNDQEKSAQNTFDQVMDEIANDAAKEAGKEAKQKASNGEKADYPDHRGDSAYDAKEEFGKKVTYIPSEGHSVWKVFSDAKELCTCSSEIESEQIRFAITFVYPCISKRVYAHILKPNRLLKMHTQKDLIVEISGTAWDKMTENERTALLHHELEHIDFKENTKTGALQLRLIDHNVKDFINILDTYGLYYLRPGLNEDD